MNLICVFRVSAGYVKSSVTGSDLLQEGIIGLMKAIIRFNPDYGVRLSTFSFFWIRKEINEFVSSNKRFTMLEQNTVLAMSLGLGMHPVSTEPLLMYTISTIGLKLSSGIKQLPIREQCLLTSRYLFNNKLTLNELSFLHGITLERIRQINVGTLKLLRNFLS
jgi:RNA polymerase sigma factor (sigma-70 family)